MELDILTAQKLAGSLTAERKTELIPFLPYLLQDLWILGTPPQDVVSLLQNCSVTFPNMRFIDLACGKGAVSVALAKAFQARGKGVDIMPEFIKTAQAKAEEHGVDSLCDFVVMDIMDAVLTEQDYDVVIFGAAGDILGSPEQTLSLLKSTVKEGGLIIIDDAYLIGDSSAIKYTNYEYLSLDKWYNIFAGAGVKILETFEVPADNFAENNRTDIESISRRAAELSNLYPDKKKLFEDYVASQKDEVSDLENSLVSIIWVLQNI